MSKTESEDPNIVTHEVIAAPGQVANIGEYKLSDGTVVWKVDANGIMSDPGGRAALSATYIITVTSGVYYAANGNTRAVDYYGADASTVINACITAMTSGTIFFTRGDYLINTTLVLKSRINLVGERGARLYTTTNGLYFISGPTILSMEGPALALTADVAEGQTTIAVDSTSLAVGDFITIMSDVVFNHTATTVGEAKLVWAKPDNASIKVNTPLVHAGYTTVGNAHVHLIENALLNCTVANLIFEGTARDDNCMGIYVTCAYNMQVLNCTFINVGDRAIAANHWVESVIDGCHILGTHKAGLGYGVIASNGTQYLTISNSHFSDCRHGFTTGSSGYYVPSHIVIQGCHYEGSDSEREHQEGKYVTKIGCTFVDAPVMLEAIHTRMYDCVIYARHTLLAGYTSDAAIFMGTSVAWADYAKVSGCTVIVDSSETPMIGIWMVNGDNMTACDNTILDIGTHAAAVIGISYSCGTGVENSGGIISGNVIDVNGPGIALTSSGGINPTDVIIANNWVKAGTLGLNISTAATHCLISGNQLEGATYGAAIRGVGNRILGNHIETTGASYHALAVYAGANETLIENNDIIAAGANAYCVYLIGLIATRISDVLINGNRLTGEYGGVRMSYTDRTIITSNTFLGTGTHGIYMGLDEVGALIHGNSFATALGTKIYRTGGSAYRIADNMGYASESRVLSADFAIDGVAVVTVTTAHGLDLTPDINDVQVTVTESTNVDDWAYGYVKVESVDATNIVCKVNVTTASATGGAKAKLAIRVDAG